MDGLVPCGVPPPANIPLTSLDEAVVSFLAAVNSPNLTAFPFDEIVTN